MASSSEQKPDGEPDPASEREALAAALLDVLDRLRDGINLALGCAMRDIQRITKRGPDAARE